MPDVNPMDRRIDLTLPENNHYIAALEDDVILSEANELRAKFKSAKKGVGKHERKHLTEMHIDDLSELALDARIAGNWDVRAVIMNMIDCLSARFYRKQTNKGY